ncbi:hypothetical protein O988_09519, partial [Pseudogymnoascus sp. VKM F-3808]
MQQRSVGRSVGGKGRSVLHTGEEISANRTSVARCSRGGLVAGDPTGHSMHGNT